MIDMKRPKPKEEELMVNTVPEAIGYERYPWGLRITLQNEELEKLGFKPKDFKIDQDVTIKCEACVTGISENESTDGEARKEVTLQIEKMEIVSEGKGTSMEEAIEYTKRRVK
jgi:hypothetical protein